MGVYASFSEKSLARRCPQSWCLVDAPGGPQRQTLVSFLKDVLPKLRRKRDDEEEKSIRRAEKKSIAEGQAVLQGMLRRADEELAKNDRVFDCPSCGVRVLLATMFSQFTNEPRFTEPAICPDDHPLFH